MAVGLGLDEVNVDPSTVCDGLPGDLEMPPDTNTSVVAVHTYQTINHGVEPQGDALNCGSCHSSQNGGPLQMDLGALGFGPRTLPSVVINTDQATLNGNLNNICSQCHGNETGGRGFDSVHSRHVQNLGKDCCGVSQLLASGTGVEPFSELVITDTDESKRPDREVRAQL